MILVYPVVYDGVGKDQHLEESIECLKTKRNDGFFW